MFKRSMEDKIFGFLHLTLNSFSNVAMEIKQIKAQIGNKISLY